MLVPGRPALLHTPPEQHPRSRARIFVAPLLPLLFLLTMLLTSCASMNDVVKDKESGKGTSATYPVKIDSAFEIARTVFRWEGCDAIEEHKDQESTC